MEGTGYYQPCKKCRQSKEYRQELDIANKEQKKAKRIDDAQKAQTPLGVFSYRGRYLYVNHRGDIVKDEKIRPMKRGEKFKRT